jgi:hypothetical protein
MDRVTRFIPRSETCRIDIAITTRLVPLPIKCDLVVYKYPFLSPQGKPAIPYAIYFHSVAVLCSGVPTFTRWTTILY